MTYAANNLASDLEDIALRLDLSDPELLTAQASCPGDWILQTAMRRAEAGAFFAIGGHPECVEVKDCPWLIKIAEVPMITDDAVHTECEREILSAETIAYLKESLSYQYPYGEATRTPSKQTATQLKGRLKDQEVSENANKLYGHAFRKAGFVPTAVQAADIGTAVHKVLRYIDLNTGKDADSIREEIKRLIDAELISQDEAAFVDSDMLAAMFETPVGKKLRSGMEVLREFKFSLLVDAADTVHNTEDDKILLQGVVDCAIIEDDGITVIDYKTDRVTLTTLEDKVKQYTSQVRAYSDALQRIYMKPVKSTYLYFFSLNKFVEICD